MTLESIKRKYGYYEKEKDPDMFDDGDSWLKDITPEEDEFLWNYVCKVAGVNIPNPCPKTAVKQDPLNEH